MTDDDASSGYSLVLATSDSPHIDIIAGLLHTQWPRGGSHHDYLQKISSTGNDNDDLPCSFILLYQDAPVGHVRITECLDESSARAVAATYILTEPRGQGHGRHLLRLLEDIVLQPRYNYHYIYVWTHTAVDFYRKCGYRPTVKVSLHRPCLKRLETNQVSKIEALLSNRILVGRTTEQATRPSETVMLPPENDDASSAAAVEDVWLRKRLVESVPVQVISREERLLELESAIQQQYSNVRDWKYYLNNLPWNQQIGPSCGLAALRMVMAAAAASQQSTGSDMVAEESDIMAPSLLDYAIQNGFSTDGELFDANHLLHLAQHVCHLQCRMESFRATTAWDVLRHLQRGRWIIFAYDSQQGTKRPCLNEGKSAHYGIIVGMLMGRNIEKMGDNAVANYGGMQEIMDEADAAINSFDTDSSVLLLVQHGLARQLVIATWSDFVASNQQLRTVDRTKHESTTEMDLSDNLIIVEQY